MAKIGMVGAVMLLIGAILLIVALFTPWYTYGASGGGVSENTNFYPGFAGQNGTVQFTCSGTPSCPAQTSYSNEHLNNTAQIAETGFSLLIVGFIVGLLAAVLGLMSGRKPGHAGKARLLGILALIIALITPIIFLAALPGAIAKDTPNHPAGSGPWSSFFGSNSTSYPGGTESITWGAGVGWYLAFVAFVLFLLGIILLSRARKQDAAMAAAPPMYAPSADQSTMAPMDPNAQQAPQTWAPPPVPPNQ
jgi:hypothetical protein